MSLRDMIEGKDFYVRRQYKSKHYQVPIPFRPLTEYELFLCESKANKELDKEEKEILTKIGKLKNEDIENLEIPADIIDVFLKKQYIESFWVILLSVTDFVENLTIEIIKKIKEPKAFARKIKEASGVYSGENIKSF